MYVYICRGYYETRAVMVKMLFVNNARDKLKPTINFYK